MEPAQILPLLLGVAVLLPLASFFVILLFGPKMGHAGEHAGYVATGAIVGACVLSFISLFIWLGSHWPEAAAHHDTHQSDRSGEHKKQDDHHGASKSNVGVTPVTNVAFHPGHVDQEGHEAESVAAEKHPDKGHATKPAYTDDYYLLGQFGHLRLTISYYIDTLTVVMFCMVTLIASCIHFYSTGYMHDELHDFTDHEVHMRDGSHLHRPGRYHRFFQYMSLFCFSMLGLVLAGNIAMVFVFWELVGICSYFLIGFYVERKSASTAANKAFIVNRIGDFGMIIGLMALWTGLGTFAFGDVPLKDPKTGEVVKDDHGKVLLDPGIFSLVRPDKDKHPLGPEHAHELIVPDGMVQAAASDRVAAIVRDHMSLYRDDPRQVEIASNAQIQAETHGWREQHYGYWLLVIAGIGIFCGCVGKSAQFPLHTWLPDAMEGPTPVSALVHSATMVAAGVYLVGRFYPVFTTEVLLVIAIVGCITLFMAATIAITATDIKRVLAYSTVSQLGYMMLSLGVGGWAAGLTHLITHAFFKSLLFLCSGSVIHAVHTNELPQMGGLLKKMPYTAITMLIGCLAIAGVGFPMVIFGGHGIGLSGFYSKDAILEQAYSFMQTNGSAWSGIFFCAAAGGAAITSFYMFRLWFLAFAGKPRDPHRYDHAHESPKVMYVPLMILAFFAVTVAWQLYDFVPGHTLNLVNLLEQARPAGTGEAAVGALLTSTTWPAEHDSHALAIRLPVTLLATGTWIVGIGLACAFYWWRYLDAADVRKTFQPIYRLLINKWWFDELYDFLFVRPTHVISRLCSMFDRRYIDGLIDGSARLTRWFSSAFEWLADQTIVDGFVNLLAAWAYSLGVSLRQVQTGRIRQYVLFIVVGTIAIFILISFFWSPVTTAR
jgi:proton-translocating NADH-quinone oxidoreductase chain L